METDKVMGDVGAKAITPGAANNNHKVAKFFSIAKNTVGYRLKISFAFFFIVPIFGFLYFGFHYNLLEKQEATYYFLAVLLFALFGYIILKQIMEGVEKVSRAMSQEMTSLSGHETQVGDELEEIMNSFKALNSHLEKSNLSLEKRMTEIEALRSLSDLSFAAIDSESLFTHALERVVEVTKGMGGAVFEIEERDELTFLIHRSITGKGFRIREGEEIPLSAHPARHAVEANESMLISRSTEPGWDGLFNEAAAQIAVVPMRKASGFNGMAVVVKEGDDLWSNDVLNFLSTYFSTVITALRIQNLGCKEREKAEDLKTVLYILEKTNSGLYEDEMLLAIAEKLDEVIPYSWIGLALLEETDGDLRLAHTFRKSSPKAQIGMIFPLSNSLFHSTMRSRGVVVIEDIGEASSYFEKEILENLGLNSCITAGLSFKGKSIGVLCLGHAERGAFNKKHGNMLSMIAEGMSIAIGQSRLWEKAKTKAGELEVLNRVGRALTSSTFNMDRVLAYTLEMISGLVKVEAGSLLLADGDDLVFKVALGEAGEKLKGQRIKFGKGVVGWAAATGEPIMVRDAAKDPHFLSELDDNTGFKTKNLLCVPLIVNGRTIGVIELLNKKVGTFNEEDLNILKSVASSAAIALENSRLYTDSTKIAKKERLIRNIFQKYVPEEVTNEILGLGERDLIAVGEKRPVTLLNVDIRGYSRMSKEAKAEEVVEVLNYFFMMMGKKVLKHKGILDKYLGDGLLAIFGAPVATRNPALDATLAAIEMAQDIEKVSKFSEDRCGISLKIGISINTGDAIVGNIGFEKKMDYTAIGDVVNDTFRLQEHTREKPDSILVGSATYQKIHPFVEARSLGIRELGTAGGRMEVYEVTGKKEMSDIEYLMHQAKFKDALQTDHQD